MPTSVPYRSLYVAPSSSVLARACLRAGGCRWESLAQGMSAENFLPLKPLIGGEDYLQPAPLRSNPSLSSWFCARDFLEPLIRTGTRCRLIQRVPVVGWVAIVQHTVENLVGIIPGPVCAQGSLIIHPGEDDDFRTRIVAKEQAE